MSEEAVEEIRTTIVDPQLEVRSEHKRELGLFIVPWETVVDTNLGPEMFMRGAFSGIDPSSVRLRMDHQDPPTGRGLALEERADGAYMAFRVSKTSRGSDQLELIKDGTSVGASVGFEQVPGGTAFEQRNGRGVRVHRKVNLREVSTTWRPTYERAAVMYVRSANDSTEVAPMADSPAPETIGATEPTAAPVTYDFTPFENSMTKLNETLGTVGERLEKLEERSRSNFTIPSGEPEKPKASRGDWMRTVIGMMSGERISSHDLETRSLADLITVDNIGVVPDAFSTELIGVIDPRRPFMQTTRKLNTPASGMSLTMPKIVTRPTVAEQAVNGTPTEKAELSSTATSVTTVTFDAVSKGGAGDISLQLLKRSDPSFLGLYLELLAEAYAQEAEQEAVEALLASGTLSGGAMDPEALVLASAWQGTFDAIRRPPDTIWLSSAAVGAFLDAKSDGTNAPLYGQITSNFSAGGGVGGSISGLRAVHVPALDSTASDVIIGPSTGFAWAEDGTYTLQVDVPAKAGRDVAIIGMLWFAPLYPAAFTVYSVAGGGS
jgi:HK97 family phage prohead protease/HK97 family phage major capsid protein